MNSSLHEIDNVSYEAQRYWCTCRVHNGFPPATVVHEDVRTVGDLIKATRREMAMIDASLQVRTTQARQRMRLGLKTLMYRAVYGMNPNQAIQATSERQ